MTGSHAGLTVYLHPDETSPNATLDLFVGICKINHTKPQKKAFH